MCEYFNIQKTCEYFQSCLIENEDIAIGAYLDAYKELNRFCCLLGSVFSFVSSEIESKSDVMHELRRNCKEKHYDTLKGMIEFEKNSNILSNESYVSGCRTLLRLHRGLDFIRTFLRRVSELGLNDSTSSVGSQVYHKTLGKYHGWLIRQGAFIAMKFLPCKRNLINNVCGKDHDDIEAIIPHMLQAADEVYRRSQVIYEYYYNMSLERPDVRLRLARANFTLPYLQKNGLESKQLSSRDS